MPDSRWYVVCEARAAGSTPCSVEVLGRPHVVWRDRSGRPSVLVDRCPHRNTPLSLGRVREEGLECSYHGWTFAADGRCLSVPGRLEAEDARGCAAESVACVEQDGLLWGCFGPLAPGSSPPRPRLVEHAGAGLVRERLCFDAALADVAENILDVPHTRILHGGLFRSRRAGNEIAVVVRRTASEVEGEYLSEPRPAGWIGRILAPRGGMIAHWDRFRLPATAEVEYRLGDSSALIATSFLTPESAFRTRLYSFVSYRTPLPRWLTLLVVAPLLRHVARQDAGMLAAQTDNVRKFGGTHFHSTALDALGAHIRDLLRD